jgi:hypothetical protein
MTKRNVSTLIAVVSACVIVSALVIFAPIITHWFGYTRPQNLADLGDLYGWVAALFSGFAFIGVIFAIILQREELKLQRNELELTREELRGQKEQLQAQNKTFRQETFENTFFQLLRLHHDIVQALRVPRAHVVDPAEGRECFQVLFSTLQHRFNERPNIQDKQTRIIESYEHFIREVQGFLGHYLRNLYNILNFVHTVGVEDPNFYMNLVRAQLSTFELLLLFYAGLGGAKTQNFKPLIERYSLFEGFPEERLMDLDHSSLYDRPAFRR